MKKKPMCVLMPEHLYRQFKALIDKQNKPHGYRRFSMSQAITDLVQELVNKYYQR